MKKLNNYLADLVVAHVKLQNMHWNVVGPHFINAHEYLEEIYRELYEYIDEVAEFLVMNKERPYGSLKDFSENTSIDELKSQEYKAGETMRFAQKTLESLRESADEIHEETDNYMLEALLEDQIEKYNEFIWFLDSMTQPGHRNSDKH